MYDVDKMSNLRYILLTVAAIVQGILNMYDKAVCADSHNKLNTIVHEDTYSILKSLSHTT